MFVATANLSAQTYDGGTWYSLYDANGFNLETKVTSFNGVQAYRDVFAPVGGNLTFNWQYNGWAFPSHDTYIYESSDGGSNYSGEKGHISGTGSGTGNVSLSANINKIKFDRPTRNTNTVKYTNIKLPLAKHILLYDDTDSKGMDYGTSSIGAASTPRHLVNLATAEGQTSTNYYTIKFRSFLASGDIKMTSNNPEFHFGGGVTEIYFGVANNYCASANGSGSCTNASTLGHISSYYKDVYFSPSVQYNTKARSTTITITDGVNTAYVYLTAPVIPTYYFKAEAIAEPTTAGVATATFVNGQSTYSLVAPNVGTNSMSAEVTFAASAGANSVFEGWKKVAEDTYYKQGSGTESFKETITSSVLDPRGMASQKTYRAIFSERYTASMETNDISGLKVGGSATAVYSFINTSAAIPSSDENADFHYVITHRPDNTTKNGSADASKVVSFDPSTKQVVGLNSGSATITFVQKQNATHEYVAKSFEVTVEKNAIDAWIVRGDAVLNELVENAFSVTDGLQDYSVESLNSSIAEYVAGNKIQTYFTEGTAQFRVTRDEDYKYVGLNELFDLEVKKSGDVCYLVENASTSVDHEFGQNSNGTYSEVYTLNGIGDKLNFMCKLSDNADAEHYLVAQYSTSDTGDFYDLTGSYVSTKKDNEHVLNGLTLPEGTKRIRFKRTAQTIGTKNFSIYNIYVTRKKELDHQVAGNGLVLDPVNIGQISQKSFNLKWSTCADEIVLVSDKDLFELNTTSINASNGGGNTNIQVTFKGSTTPGVYQAFISVYDRTQVEHLTVTCEVKDKLNTTIHYTGAYQYSEGHDCLTGLFYVQDEVPNVVEGALVKLSSSNEDILEICEDRTSFIPHCGGQVTLTATYAGDDTHEAAQEWSGTIQVANCYQTIDWDQDFRQYIAAEDGTINQTTPLTAVAVPTNFDITYELDESAQKFAKIENGSLVIFGIGTGHIIASAPSGTYETKYYDAASLMHEIRVRKWGDKCNTDESVASDEITLSALFSWFYDDEEVIGLDGRPYERMEFYSHVSSGSGKNELTVSFSADGGATWSNSQTYTIPETYDWNTPYIHANVPEGANQVKFKTTSTGMTYFNMVKMVQESYLRAKDMDGNNLDKIVVEDAIVNEPFSRTFTVEYSDVPLIQYSVTDSHDLGLKLEPNPTISNDCGDWGTYTFTLKGESPYPQSGVIEKIRLYTSAGDEVVIPITITATLSEPFFFNVQDGDWNESTKWTHKGSTTHGMVPDKQFPVVVSKALQIGNESTSCKAVAYNVTIEGEGNVKIGSKGGLTLHAGGFAEGVTNDNFTIENNQDGVGYVRVSPYFINKVPGTMPNITVQYTTRAKAGGAKDQVWQYVGAPGNNMQMSNDGVMVYLWSETDGWVYSNTNMTPFEGYALTRTAEGAETYSIVAQPIHDNKTINLTKTANGMNGDNLFVNSYLAPIDLTKFTTDGEDSDFTGNVEKTFYLFNSGSWNDWQGENGEGANNILKGESAGKYHPITPLGAALIDANKDQTTIPPMQGVYVVANGDAQIHLKYNKHVFRSTSSDMNRPMRAPQIEDENFMRVRMQVNSQNSGADRMYVIQYENTTRGYDNGYDAKNIIAQGQANIYTNEPEGQMEISIADQIDSTFIGFAAGEDSEYTLTFTSLVGQDMYLHDLEADSLFLLIEEGEYTFSAHPNSVNDMRFQLLLYPDFSDDLPGNGVTTGIDNLVSSAQVWVNDKRVYIADAPQNSTLSVYTISGMSITSPLTIHHAPCTIDLSHLPTGVYVLRLNNQAYKFVCE